MLSLPLGVALPSVALARRFAVALTRQFTLPLLFKRCLNTLINRVVVFDERGEKDSVEEEFQRYLSDMAEVASHPLAPCSSIFLRKIFRTFEEGPEVFLRRSCRPWFWRTW